jgi:hypothetical protein
MPNPTITNFKHTLSLLPSEAHGYEAFVKSLSNEHAVVAPTREFLAYITNDSFAALHIPVSTSDHNPHILLAALTMARFPIEMLCTPEKPLELMLLNRATNLLLAIDRVLREYGGMGAGETLSAETAKRFLMTLGEFRLSWAEWWGAEMKKLQTAALNKDEQPSQS